jgi:rhamnose transport system substrate-binding protein
MESHVKSGAAPAFALWNPIDLGYAATTIAYNLAKGMATAAPGAEISMGKVGTVTLDDTNSGPMAPPFVFDASNIEEFAKIY